MLGRGCQGQPERPIFNDPGSVDLTKMNFQAPARHSCDGMDFGPLWGRKTNTGVCFSSVLKVVRNPLVFHDFLQATFLSQTNREGGPPPP
jgi:hypothetical protein